MDSLRRSSSHARRSDPRVASHGTLATMKSVVVVAAALALTGCKSPVGRDETCAQGDDTGYQDSTPCDGDLVCAAMLRGDTSSFSVCVPPTGRSRGEPCDNSSQCAGGVACSLDATDPVNSAQFCGGKPFE